MSRLRRVAGSHGLAVPIHSLRRSSFFTRLHAARDRPRAAARGVTARRSTPREVEQTPAHIESTGHVIGLSKSLAKFVSKFGGASWRPGKLHQPTGVKTSTLRKLFSFRSVSAEPALVSRIVRAVVHVIQMAQPQRRARRRRWEMLTCVALARRVGLPERWILGYEVRRRRRRRVGTWF